MVAVVACFAVMYSSWAFLMLDVHVCQSIKIRLNCISITGEAARPTLNEERFSKTCKVQKKWRKKTAYTVTDVSDFIGVVMCGNI